MDYHGNADPGIKDKDLWNFSMVPSGINREQAGHGSLHLYPNPAGDFVMIELPDDVVGEVIIDVFDLTGRKVSNFKIFNNGNPVEYNTASLKPGLYFIHCTPTSSHSQSIGIFIKSQP